MKKIVTLFLFILFIQNTKAQFVTIPDANFVTWLQAAVPSAMSGNQMDTTSLAVTTKTYIKLHNLNIADLTGIQYFTSLDTLECSHNPITTITALPNSITYLYIFMNPLTSLSALPSSLLYFNINGAQLTTLPSLPSSIEELYCRNNQLTSLPSLPNSLTHIDCSYNLLTVIPPLPNSLNSIYCYYNQLASLPTLPNTITQIDCHNNNLTNFPNLPNSLVYLGCRNNQLTSIPILPNLLVNFDCSYNQLTNLSSIPNSLVIFDCSHNQLTSLSNLPTTLNSLICSYNQLISLPFLPIGLDILVCSHNNISCFPVFPNIPSHYIPTGWTPMVAFEISPNPFTCLPNYVGGMDTVTLNYPLCVSGNTLTNQNGCVTGKGITGAVFNDLNIDCMKGINELGFTNATIRLYDSLNVFLGMTNTNTNNNFLFNVSPGSYKIVLDTVSKPYVVQCINPGVDSLVNLNSNQSIEDSVDFAINCKPGFDIGVQSIYKTNAAFPGIYHTLTVVAGDVTHWNNLNCATGVAGTVSVSVIGPVTYIGPASGALTPNIIGNIYTYTVADFGLVNNSTDFKLVFQTDTNAQTGNEICINVSVLPIIGDSKPSNNSKSFCYSVVNSLDPNIKEVYPVEVQTGFNDWLTYTIHFQNTGNAPAMNIRLEDNLDTKLDPETFELINYSHYNVIDVTTNHLTVRFPNIQLADSTSNPQGSIGFVQYRIKPKAGWINDTIRNSVDIYFDYNAPITTNTAKSYFMTTTGIKDISYLNEVIELSPNPTNSIISVSSQTNFNKVEVLSITGQTLLSEKVNSKTHQLQLQNFAEGIYFVKVSYADGRSLTKKVIKQ
jgi:uncharacterized repeat protein (TIGR01451 family)